VAIAAGVEHSLALRADGSIVVWGNRSLGRGYPPAGNDFVAIAAGYYHSLALRADGSIVAWGYSGYGQAEPPAGNDFVAIAAGDHHSLALRADGSIIAWGQNFYGQADFPDGYDFIAIACGSYHNLALRADGTIYAWGDDRYGQTDVPEGDGFIGIAGGDTFSMALKESPLSVLPVFIDIKPGSNSNKVNLRSMGVIPVAILSSGSFDATAVDPATVTLNGAGVQIVGRKQKLMAHMEDVNMDGFVDLICQINTRMLSLEPGESIAILQGNTYDGTAIEGEDFIYAFKPPAKRHNRFFHSVKCKKGK
jgi:alpha-tubulin suppressor-like RCC1 family protein